MGHEVAQGGSVLILFELRRGDGSLVDPDNFNEATQATWPVTVLKDPSLNVLGATWKPAGTEGDDPDETGLYRYGVGQYGQRVLAPSGSTVADGYRIYIQGDPPYGIGGAAYTGYHTFDVVDPSVVTIPPSGLIDRAYANRVLPFEKMAAFGYTVQADMDALVDDAIRAASDAVRSVTKRSFLPETRTFKLDVLETDEWLLPLGYNPVLGVSSVKENGRTLTSGTDYAWRADGRLLRHDSAGTPKGWGRGVGSVEVTVQEGHSSVPEDVKWATARIVESLLAHYLARRQGAFVRVGEFEVAAPSLAMTEPAVRETLARYARGSFGVV